MTILDYSPTAIDFAKKRFRKERLSVKACQGDIYELPFKSNSFDFSFSQSSLANLENPDKAVGELARTLAQGGKLVLCAPNKYRVDGSWLYRHLAKFKYFQREYSLRKLVALGKKHGLEPIDFFGYDNFYFITNQIMKVMGVPQKLRTSILAKLNKLPLPIQLKLFVGVIFQKP